MTSESYMSTDIERLASARAQLENTTVHNFGWQDVTVTVKDRATKQPIAILDNVNGFVNAGKISIPRGHWKPFSCCQVRCVP